MAESQVQKDLESMETLRIEETRVNWGTNLQMLFYGVACVLFWSVLMNQLPFISTYFGGKRIFFYIPLAYGLSSNISRIVLMILHAQLRRPTGSTLSQFVYLGGTFTAVGMFLFALCIAILSTGYPTLGFCLCMGITCIVGAFNSLLVTGGYALMALSPRRSGQFFLLGLTATGIITWPCMMGMRALVGHFSSDTSYIVALLSLSATGVLCLVSTAVYRFKTSRNPYFLSQLSSKEENTVGLYATLNRARSPLVCLWLSRLFTFALYPGMIALWTPSVSNAVYSEPVYQSFLIYLGPVSDTVGQLCYRYIPCMRLLGRKSLILLTVIRGAVLVPLFWFSALYNGNGTVIASDAFRCGLMFVFSCSMGVNYSLGSSVALSRVDGPDEKYTIGVLISFAAMNGLFVGSLVGIALKSYYGA
jgi:hypothetical protein